MSMLSDSSCPFSGLVFFFKQKTAYEMRISDWSSDVCSSDLLLDPAVQPRGFLFRDHRADEGLAILGIARDQRFRLFDQHIAEPVIDIGVDDDPLHPDARLAGLIESAENDRSEEHTSEIQSLMPISYAVFCLKNKNH